jgi:hypothetical protein
MKGGVSLTTRSQSDGMENVPANFSALTDSISLPISYSMSFNSLMNKNSETHKSMGYEACDVILLY